jgi:F-type H+-transporting ATPase subunit delta
MVSVSAARYARALADVILDAKNQVTPEATLAAMQAVEAAMQDSPELRATLLNPAVAGPKKRAVLGRLADSLGVPAVVKNFLYVAVDRRRIHQLAEIRQGLEQMLDERLGLVRADIASAHALTEAQRAQIEAQLARLSGKRIRPHYAVDAALVGGVVARVAGTVYDGSVRGQLEALRRKLVAGA